MEKGGRKNEKNTAFWSQPWSQLLLGLFPSKNCLTVPWRKGHQGKDRRRGREEKKQKEKEEKKKERQKKEKERKYRHEYKFWAQATNLGWNCSRQRIAVKATAEGLKWRRKLTEGGEGRKEGRKSIMKMGERKEGRKKEWKKYIFSIATREPTSVGIVPVKELSSSRLRED
jgi:hypothetical protein